MTLNLIHLEQRIKELESLAEEVLDLAEKMSQGGDVQPHLSIKGQRWYRGSRALLEQQNFSGINDFDFCYTYYNERRDGRYTYGIRNYITGAIDFRDAQHRGECFATFSMQLRIARALLLSMVDEIYSRELPIRTELSFQVSTNEFDTAKDIFDQYSNEEVFLRVSGIVARVAIERHIRTVADTRNIVIIRNPPTKTHDDFTDITNTLRQNSVITSHQKSELDLLYRTGNNCAHPKETVVASNVKQLIERGRELASMIL
jgi:hypothetical protein